MISHAATVQVQLGIYPGNVDHLPMTEDNNRVHRNRLRWRSRRGLLELDLLLVPFVDDGFESLDAEGQAAYARMLEEEDPDLLSWFSRSAIPVDAEFARLVNTILDRVQP